MQRWRGDLDARRAAYNNRARLRSGVGQEAFKLRAEKVERSSQHTLDRGGMRHTWLRGQANVHKRVPDAAGRERSSGPEDLCPAGDAARDRYDAIWQGCDRITRAFAAGERRALFRDNAARLCSLQRFLRTDGSGEIAPGSPKRAQS